jgi:ABC-2 type transport system ATP-binding protein
MFGILGLNGAGKTTLLKMIATLILPDAGTASVCGEDLLNASRAVRRLVSMVLADERSLNWRLSARENIALFAGLHRMDSAQISRRTTEVLAAVNLQDTAEKMVGAFSSGMRQRLLLARALLSRPRVLLLDEPTKSLDPVAAHEFRSLLRNDIVDGSHATVILATHNPDEAFNYCDRVAVLHHGAVAALGSARSLATRLGQDRYRIWTSTTGHPCFGALALRGLITDTSRLDRGAEGTWVECTVVGGEAAAAEVLRRLVEGRVSITSFERVPSDLAALVARIVETQQAATSKAGHDA